MSAHTPGPWKVRDYKTGEGDLWIDCDNWTGRKLRGSPTSLGGTLATAHARGTGPGCVEANARLIAAAPDLLAALQEARSALSWPEHAGTFEVVDAALKKAVGE